MRTRTLLLLAVACGLAILGAGLALLLRIDTAAEPAPQLRVGDSAQAGDLRVAVLSATEGADGRLRVEVRLGGVVDESIVDEFRLAVPGRLVVPVDPDEVGAGACDAITVDERTCTLAFDVGDAPGTARSLVVRRGEDQRRWDLAAAAAEA